MDERDLRLGMENEDKHTASIELSNKCREFYRRRLEHIESSRQRMSPTFNTSTNKMSTIDVAMQKLGKEMSSLMDQDLSLMKQLLLLNETIEELKFQRRYSNSSMPCSSCDLSGSEQSVSETDMYDSQDDLDKNNMDVFTCTTCEFRHRSDSTHVTHDLKFADNCCTCRKSTGTVNLDNSNGSHYLSFLQSHNTQSPYDSGIESSFVSP